MVEATFPADDGDLGGVVCGTVGRKDCPELGFLKFRQNGVLRG